MLNDPVNLVDPWGLIWWEILTPTEIGPEKILYFNKQTKKWVVYDFNTGISKDWFQPNKIGCETRKPPISEESWIDDLIKQKQKRNLHGKRPGKIGTLFDLLCRLFGC